MSQSMQANITICTNTNICARAAQKHLFTHIRQWHIHLLTFSHTHKYTHSYTHSFCEPNVRWPLFTSTHFIDKRNVINTGKKTTTPTAKASKQRTTAGREKEKKAPRNRKEEAAGVLRTRTTLPVVVTHSKHPHTWISYARHLLHKNLLILNKKNCSILINFFFVILLICFDCMYKKKWCFFIVCSKKERKKTNTNNYKLNWIGFFFASNCNFCSCFFFLLKIRIFCQY